MALRMQMLFGIVVIDTWLVASLGENALAAMGLAAAIGGLLLGAQNAFANASQILVAQAFGAGTAAGIKNSFRTGLAINLGVCALGVVLLLAFAKSVLGLTDYSDAVKVDAYSYLMIFIGVVVAEAVGQSLSAFCNGCGNTRIPLNSYLISMPLNVGFSYGLIHGVWVLPEMGLQGAALGSVIGSVARAGYLWVALRKMSEGWRMAETRPLWPAIRTHLAFSLPVAATFFSAQASNSVCMLIYAQYDVYDFAALTLIMPWIQVVGTFGMAWAQAAGIAVAQHLGRSGHDHYLRPFLTMAFRGAFWTAGVVAVVYAAVILSAEWLYPTLEAQTLAALLSFLPILLILPWPKNSNAICGNSLRAAGRTVYVMHIFLWSQWGFKVPASLFLVFVLDAPVVWVVALQLAEEFVKFTPFHLGLMKSDMWRGARG